MYISQSFPIRTDRKNYLYSGYFPRVNASDKQYYRYCASQIVRINLNLPAFHTISYEGPMKSILRFHYHAVPSAIEDLYVNESIDIKHSEGTLQRTIVVDANKERLSVSFDVRKFDGPSDLCGYGGIRMFNQVKASYSYGDKHNTLEAHIPHSNIRKKLHKQYTKNSKYFPICTNDSLIFERKFYLDFGKTYFVFYDFNSLWSVDVTLHVHPSTYNAIHNFEEFYCNNKINMFMFNDFFINCALRLVRLTRQVPIILQWFKDSRNIKLANLKLKSRDIEGIWPGSMDLMIYQNFRNVSVFTSDSQICRSKKVLLVTGLANVTSVLLGRHTQNQSIPNAESITIRRFLGNCPLLDQGSHAIILTPPSSQKDSRCILMRQDFLSTYFTYDVNKKYQTFNKGCVSLNVIMTVGMYELYIMEPFYYIPIQNKWIFYYLAISEHCYRSSGMKIYFQTILFNETQAFYFEFSEETHHYIWYDFGITSVVYFHLERYLVACTAYIEFTSSPYRLEFPYVVKDHFKVHVSINEPPPLMLHVNKILISCENLIACIFL